MRTPTTSPLAALRGLTLLALVATTALAGCKIKDVTFTEGGGSGSNDDAGPGDDAVVTTDAPDAGPPTFVVDLMPTVGEGATRTFTVMLSAPPTDFMLVDVTTDDPDKLGVSPTTLLFSGSTWSTPQTVTLTGKADSNTVNETVGLTLASTAVAAPFAADITIEDDDGLGLALSAASLDVFEGQTGVVNVSLTAQPAADVTVAIAVGNVAAAQLSLAQMTFTPANWSTAQPLSVTGLQDADTANVSTMLAFTSADFSMVTLPVQITDDDVLGISLSASALTITEGGAGDVNVVLTQQPSGAVQVAIATADAAVAAPIETTLAFDETNWDIPQTVTVSAPDDVDVAAGSTTLTLSSTGLTPRTVAVTVNDDDRQAITTTPATTVTITEGMTATVNARLAFKPSADVTVNVSSLAPSTATATPATLTFTPTNYATVQPVTVSALSDADAVPGATTLRLESPAESLTTDVTVAITDDDTLGIRLSAATVAVTEGMTATVNVRLTAQPQATTTVSITSGDTSSVTSTPSLTFTTANWNVDQAVTLTGVEDVDLVGEVVTLTLASAGMADATLTANVTENDTQAIVGTPATVSVIEGGTGTLGVKLAYQPSADVAVTVASANPAAATVNPTTLTFTPANYATTQNVTVTGVQDADTANAMTTVNLTASGVNATAITVNVADDDALNIDLTPSTLSITEQGTPGVLMVRLTAQPAANTAVMLATSDAGAAGLATTTLTFTTTNWNTYQSVNVTGTDDVDATNETVTITASSTGLSNRTATVTVTDNDPLNIATTVATVAVNEGGTGTFGVKLTAQPAGTVTVNIASADPTAATVSPTQLTFDTATWNTNQTVTITGVQDNDLVGESVALTLTATGVGSATVTANLTDNDTQALILDKTSLSVAEGANNTFTVKLAFQPSADVSVTVASTNTAVATVTTPLTFTSTNWATAQVVVVTGVQDANAANATAAATVSTTGVTSQMVTITVVDDDVLGLDVETPITITEGASGTFEVVLTAQPAANTSVTITSGNVNKVTVSPATLTFTTANWNVPQSVTATGVEDADTANEVITVTAASSGLTSRTSTVNVTDNDVQSLIVSTTSTSVFETATRTFTVRLAAQPASNVTVTVTSSATSIATVSPSPLTFTPANYATAQTVTIDPVADADYDFELATITVASSGLTSRQISLTVAEAGIINPVTINPTSICRFETATMPVRLRGNPRGTFTVYIDASSTNLSPSPTSLSFTALNYATNRNVFIEGLGTISNGTVTVYSRSSGYTAQSDTMTVLASSAPACFL